MHSRDRAQMMTIQCSAEVAHNLAATMESRSLRERSQTKAGEYLAVAVVLATAWPSEEDALRAERDAALAEAARVREANEYLEGANAALRDEHQQLCVDWVKALGNPANPEELDKAIAETPGMHVLVRSVPWEGLHITLEYLSEVMQMHSPGIDAWTQAMIEDVGEWLSRFAPSQEVDDATA